MPEIVRKLVLAVPVSKNPWQRWFWAKRQAVKKDWEAVVWSQVNQAPRWPRRVDHVTVSLTVYWDKPGTMPDHHNLDMAHEVIADGLVKSGILADDAKGVYQRGDFHIYRVPRGQGFTEATVVLRTDG